MRQLEIQFFDQANFQIEFLKRKLLLKHKLPSLDTLIVTYIILC